MNWRVARKVSGKHGSNTIDPMFLEVFSDYASVQIENVYSYRFEKETRRTCATNTYRPNYFRFVAQKERTFQVLSRSRLFREVKVCRLSLVSIFLFCKYYSRGIRVFDRLVQFSSEQLEFLSNEIS